MTRWCAEDPRTRERHPNGRQRSWYDCYVDDVDAVYAKALAAGGTSMRAPEDMFYGDRISMVKDTCGNIWAISTHKRT